MKNNYLESPLKTFVFALAPYKKRFFAMLVLIILGNVMAYSLPLFLKVVVDKVVENSGLVSFSDLFSPFLLLVLALLLQELFFRTGHIIETYLVPDVFRHLSTSLYKGLIKRPTSYFENKFSGDLGRRIEQASSSAVYFIESTCWGAGWVFMSLIMAAIVLSSTHRYIFLTFLAWSAFFILSSVPILVWHRKTSEKVATTHAHFSGNIVDTLSNISLVQSFGGISHEESRNQEVTGEVVRAERKMRWVSVLDKFQNGISLVLLGTSLVFVSIVLFVEGKFSVGDFVLVSAVIPSLVGTIWSFGEIVMGTSRQYGTLSDAIGHLRERQEYLLGGNVSDIPEQKYSVEFKNVNFQYPKTHLPVFRDFSLSVRDGERVGIVGASGVGKSTLVKLLLRQHAYSAGSIAIGGIPIQDFDLNVFHGLISYVPQDTSLFHRSLFENIKYAKIDATNEQVMEASKKSNAHEFIKDLPQGYDTKVGERGIKLSGGQRQRIALARAILKNAPILILDEATSSLDTESENFIQEALTSLFAGRTVIAIAHRLSTLKAMDRIVVLENGVVVENGNPQELLKSSSGIFKKMWDQQKNGFVS